MSLAGIRGTHVKVSLKGVGLRDCNVGLDKKEFINMGALTHD